MGRRQNNSCMQPCGKASLLMVLFLSVFLSLAREVQEGKQGLERKEDWSATLYYCELRQQLGW